MKNSLEIIHDLRQWVARTPTAAEAAKWLLSRAAATGRLPARIGIDLESPHAAPLTDFFSARYVRLSGHGRRLTLHFDQWEQQTLRDMGAFPQLLAEVCGKPLLNNRQRRQERRDEIQAILAEHLTSPGLPGDTARREAADVATGKGRMWSRWSKGDVGYMRRELTRYFALLGFTEALRQEPARIERLIHVSRRIAGDTHWLRPHNQIWRDLADDLLWAVDFPVEGVSGNELSQARIQILSDAGLVENLVSVAVLAFGHVALRRDGAVFRWPAEAAHHGLPVWLAAVHLLGAEFLADTAIEQVVSLENETSFLDRVEQRGAEKGTVLVYTSGQGNRAVVGLLRLLASAFPRATFHHEGDLDIPGIRILASLQARTGLEIRPLNMDAAAFNSYQGNGIPLTPLELAEVERCVVRSDLPCQDVIALMAQMKLRIEQECITGGGALE